MAEDTSDDAVLKELRDIREMLRRMEGEQRVRHSELRGQIDALARIMHSGE